MLLPTNAREARELLDSNRIKQNILLIEEEIIEIKAKFRESHQPNLTYKDYYRIAELKKNATMLYCISAHSHHSIHMKDKFENEEAQVEFIGDYWLKYKKIETVKVEEPVKKPKGGFWVKILSPAS